MYINKWIHLKCEWVKYESNINSLSLSLIFSIRSVTHTHNSHFDSQPTRTSLTTHAKISRNLLTHSPTRQSIFEDITNSHSQLIICIRNLWLLTLMNHETTHYFLGNSLTTHLLRLTDCKKSLTSHSHWGEWASYSEFWVATHVWVI